MAASTIASAASTLACSTGTVESRVLPRHGLSSLVPAKASSPLKLVSNGSRVSMRQRLGFVASVRVLYVRNMARALGVNNGVQKTNANSGSRKELDVAGPTALALLAAAVLPEIAEAAAPGVSPSLKNLLLSVVAGGVVLVVIGGAVAAVSTFDPVKRK